MENAFTRRLYDASPVFLQHLFTSAYGWKKRADRYGTHYRRYRAFFQESFRWPRERLQRHQDAKVAETVELAYRQIPFWRQRLDRLGLRPSDIASVADLPKLPLLEKSEVRQAGTAMLAAGFPRRMLHRATTSGSTGFPLTNYWSTEALQRDFGFDWARRRPGVTRRDRYGTFTGLQIVRADSLRAPFWRFNWPGHQVCFSIFHMTPRTLPAYADQIINSGLSYLEGYPSSLAVLARFLLQHGIAPPPLKAVFVTAEQLLPEQRASIERGLGARVWDQYGLNEKAASITDYACGPLHYDMDSGVIEFIPAGRDEEGEPLHEMVCTSFDNRAFPLIRYRVGDLAVLADPAVGCDLCAGPIVRRIYGRTAQVLLSRDGRRITNMSVIAKRCAHVEAMQCIQTEPGAVDICVVRGEGFLPEDEERIVREFQKKMGQIDFRIRYVSDVERTPSGKFLSIISRLAPVACDPADGGL